MDIFVGTGSVSNLFLAFPYAHGSESMLVFSLIFFFLNLFFFVFFLSLSLAKYFIYPAKWHSLWKNPVTSLYVGCFPMGATTLINVAVQVGHERYRIGGEGFLRFIWAMWWLDVIVSFLCCWIGVHTMINKQTHSLDVMTAMWLLPVVTLIVASSSGGVVGNSLQEYSVQDSLRTTTVSTFMVAVGLSLALMILVIYLQRLITFGLPKGPTVLSVFLPLGPTGQAGYSILLIGENFRSLLPNLSDRNSSILGVETTPATIQVICVCVAFVLWSLATMWTLFALMAVYTRLQETKIAFRMSFWGLVFPNGVYANLTIQLGNTFDSPAFRIWGSIYAAGVLLLWLSIFLRSLAELKSFFKSDQVLLPQMLDSRTSSSHLSLPTTDSCGIVNQIQTLDNLTSKQH
ncbi:voltage-dependent anion channel [Crepidotus variabilis]|uniref:Voltage-dependent anion channel n=1 Tax=Crepidotus variabilis TaxID=179855 RepID=A0A9P6EMN5_9AGAR|nr:voltage-dependent anion channel [Crepidotus variabilis]